MAWETRDQLIRRGDRFAGGAGAPQEPRRPSLLEAARVVLDRHESKHKPSRDWHYCPECDLTADLADRIEHEAGCSLGALRAAVEREEAR